MLLKSDRVGVRYKTVKVSLGLLLGLKDLEDRGTGDLDSWSEGLGYIFCRFG
jgi:hypothetical protein